MGKAKKNNYVKKDDLFFLALIFCPECIIPFVGWLGAVIILLTPFGGKILFESFLSGLNLAPTKVDLIAKLLSVGIPTASWGAIFKFLAGRESDERKRNFMKITGMILVVAGAFLIMISLILVISNSLQTTLNAITTK